MRVGRERVAVAARGAEAQRVGLAFVFGDRAAAYAQSAEDDVQRRAHHLLEVARLRDLFSEVCERGEGVQDLAHLVCHRLSQWPPDRDACANSFSVASAASSL